MLTIDEAANRVVIHQPDGSQQEHALDTPEAFEAVSAAWLRCGWDVKYVYGFTWMGRPVIQLPEDMLRIQEVIWRVRPDVVIETGVAHGGSLVFYASLFAAMGHGRVIGVDIDIRQHNRVAIESHKLPTGSSCWRPVPPTATPLPPCTVPCMPARQRWWCSMPTTVRRMLPPSWKPMPHWSRPAAISSPVMASWRKSPAPHAPHPDWSWNNPLTAIDGFLSRHPEFVQEEPEFPFNEGKVRSRVTYWPRAFLRRLT